MDSERATTHLISNDKNLMPSMVVRAQQQSVGHPSSVADSGDQSATTNTLDEILFRTREAATSNVRGNNQRQTFDKDGLVVPRRVPHHHQLPAGGQQPTTMRDLNRELKFNQVRGLRVLDQKSELKRAMEKLETSRRRKEAEQERLTRRSSLELRLEERAQRLARESAASGADQSG